MKIKRIKNGMKSFVMEYLNLFNPRILSMHYPYYQLVIDIDYDWYFDVWDGIPMREEQGLKWSIGFSPEQCDFYYLYSFDLYSPQNKFIEEHWNESEFDRMLRDFSDEKLDALLNALRDPAGVVRHTCPDIPEARASKGNFWPTSWIITDLEY